MMEASCKEWMAEIVECARRDSQPRAGVRIHLKECPRCRLRWEEELRLTAELQTLREVARLRRPSEERHQQILAEFDQMRRRARKPSWRWAAAAAALLLLSLSSVEVLRVRRTPMATPPSAVQEIAEVEGADSNGFVEVPYAPPLAAGELVSVVRTELQPSALARMGIAVDLGYGNDVAADVMAGEDGLPRAVRLVDAVEF